MGLDLLELQFDVSTFNKTVRLPNDLISLVLGSSTDAVTPEISVVSPVTGSNISSSTPLVIDITDDVLVQNTFITAQIGSSVEFVYDGNSFGSQYSGSFSSIITNGKRYTLHRVGGWTASPTIKVYAVDSSGNEA